MRKQYEAWEGPRKDQTRRNQASVSQLQSQWSKANKAMKMKPQGVMRPNRGECKSRRRCLRGSGTQTNAQHANRSAAASLQEKATPNNVGSYMPMACRFDPLAPDARQRSKQQSSRSWCKLSASTAPLQVPSAQVISRARSHCIPQQDATTEGTHVHRK